MKKRWMAMIVALLLFTPAAWGAAFAEDEGGGLGGGGLGGGGLGGGGLGGGGLGGGGLGGGVDDGKPVVVYVEENLHRAVPGRLVPLGMDDETLDKWFADAIALYEEKNYSHIVLLVSGVPEGNHFELGWNPAKIDTSEVGTYHPFSVDPPPGVDLGEDFVPPEIPVYVMDPEKVYMRFFEWDGTHAKMDWLKQIDDPELWVSTDDEPWELASEKYPAFSSYFDDGTHAPNDLYDGERGSLTILTETLLPGHTYVFEIRYRDGENVGFSEDRLEIRVAEGGEAFGKELPGGDRTGEGRDEQERADEQEPALTFLAAGTSGSSNRTARTSTRSEQSVTLSGEELDALVKANPEQVTIIQDDLRVSLPSGALESLALDADDSFTIILKGSDGAADASFAINDEAWNWPFDEPYAADLTRDSGDETAAATAAAAVEEIQSIAGVSSTGAAPGGAPFLPILSIVGLSGAAGVAAYKLKGPVKRS